MAYKLVLILISVFCALASASILQQQQQNIALPMPRHSLADALQQTQAANARNPRSMDCFLTYVDELNASADKYQSDLTECDTTAKKATTQLEDATADDRVTLNETAADGCAKFSECNKQQRALAFFDCYVAASAASGSTFNNLKSNADALAKELDKKQKDIAYVKSQCDTQANTDYLKQSDKCYEDLQICLKNSQP